MGSPPPLSDILVSKQKMSHSGVYTKKHLQLFFNCLPADLGRVNFWEVFTPVAGICQPELSQVRLTSDIASINHFLSLINYNGWSIIFLRLSSFKGDLYLWALGKLTQMLVWVYSAFLLGAAQQLGSPEMLPSENYHCHHGIKIWIKITFLSWSSFECLLFSQSKSTAWIIRQPLQR